MALSNPEAPGVRTFPALELHKGDLFKHFHEKAFQNFNDSACKAPDTEGHRSQLLRVAFRSPGCGPSADGDP